MSRYESSSPGADTVRDGLTVGGREVFTSGPISVVETPTTVLATLTGDIDVRDAETVRAAAKATVAAAVAARTGVLVDCRELTFMDSSALTFFVLLVRGGRPVTVTGLNFQLRSMLSLTGVDQVLTVVPG